MKFNLKNFPNKMQAQGREYFPSDVDDWLDGFEAELREEFIDIPATEWTKGRNDLIREILGEEKK